MPMDRTAYYADASTPASIATITAAMADAEADSIEGISGLPPYTWPTSAERTAQTGMALGYKGTQTDTGLEYRYDGTNWKEWNSDYISWTTAPSNLTVGTGGAAQSTQQYKWINGRIWFRYTFVLGTTGSMGSSPTLNLPLSVTLIVPGGSLANGGGAIRDASVPSTPAFTRELVTSATTALIQSGAIGGTTITATVPMTWAAGDILAGGFWADPA